MQKFLNRILPTKYEKRITGLITMIVLLIGVSLTSRLIDQEQDIRQRANETTSLRNELIANEPTGIISPSIPTAPTIDPLATAISLTVSLSGVSNSVQALRDFTLSVYDTNNNFITSETTPLLFQNGAYTGTANIKNLQSGIYIFKVRSPGFMETSLTPIPKEITKGQQLSLPRTTLIPGDINSDGTINSIDYNLFNDCYEELRPAKNCTDNAKKEASDFNIDGKVNEIDYNILIRNTRQ